MPVVPTLGRLKGKNHEVEAHQATQQNLVLKSVTKPKSLGLTLVSVKPGSYREMDLMHGYLTLNSVH